MEQVRPPRKLGGAFRVLPSPAASPCTTDPIVTCLRLLTHASFSASSVSYPCQLSFGQLMGSCSSKAGFLSEDLFPVVSMKAIFSLLLQPPATQCLRQTLVCAHLTICFWSKTHTHTHTLAKWVDSAPSFPGESTPSDHSELSLSPHSAVFLLSQELFRKG